MQTVWSAFFMPSDFSARVALFLEVDSLFHQTVLGWLTACLRCLVFLKCNSSDLRYWHDVDTQLKQLCTANNANLAFRELLSALVVFVRWFFVMESSIGSVACIGFMTRSLGLGLMTWGLGLGLGLMSSGLVNNTAFFSRTCSLNATLFCAFSPGNMPTHLAP